MKQDYENNLLLNKIIEIEKKPSKYSQQNLISKQCPPFQTFHKTFSNKIHKNVLENQNLVIINNTEII